MLACGVLKVVAAASSGAEASSVFNTGYYRNLGRGAPQGARREPPAGFRLPGPGQGNGCWVRRELGQGRGAGMCKVLAARGRGADRSWRPRAPAI